MKTPRLFARPQAEARGWNNELALRYGAATVVTLIALAAAQLELDTQFMIVLGAITIAGVPVALWMRLHDMRFGGVTVPRPLWNTLTVIASGVTSLLYLSVPLRNIMAAVQGGMDDKSLLKIGTNEPMLLLVQLFLVFAAFRSFSIISDKDATLATVPSFSVLLLLIPVHPQIEVVCYFIVWTMVATMLFALDHRSEIHAQATATVPAPAPGQDVKLAARSLSGVLGISLLVAVSLSGLLTARDPRASSSSDSAISLLASRLTQFTLQTQSSSGSNGPERQIDFSSGAALPTRAELWKTSASTQQDKPLNPPYWRLFTLSDYKGSSWTQNNDGAVSVNIESLAPLFRSDGSYFSGERFNGRRARRASRDERRRALITGAPSLAEAPSLAGAPFSIGPPRPTRETTRNGNARDFQDQGFDVGKALPALLDSFGTPTELVRYRMTATRASLGFVPLLPTPTRLIMINGEQSSLRARPDGGMDVSFMNINESFVAYSQVPRLPEYGFSTAQAPQTLVAFTKSAPQLSAAERAINLALPAKLPARVRQLARNSTRGASADSSNYARALLLAQATQRDAIYTLRPPTIPIGRDAADFFLFESRRGYCTYFAGALTVLCRAQNIPARVVSGFVTPDKTGLGESTIRSANAHAWTEVWVENWGWAVVDATPVDDRGDNAPTLLENWSDLVSSKLDAAFRWSLAHWITLSIGVGGLLLAFVAWRFRRDWMRWLGRESAPDAEWTRRQIAADYARASRQLARRFRPRQSWETPDEWLGAARAQVPQLPLEALQTLTALYVRALFSPQALSSEAAQQARVARENLKWKKAPKSSRPSQN